MARNILQLFSVNDGPAHEARIFDDAGAQVGAVIAAAYVGAGTNSYTVAVPVALPDGFYSWAGYRTSNGRLRSNGEFYWDNATQCIIDTEEVELTSADVQIATAAAIVAADLVNQTDLDAAEATIVTNTDAEILALGTAINNSIVISEANIIANTDAEAAIIVAVIAALNDISAADIQAELVTYDGATQADLDACCNLIQADIAALNDLSSVDIAAALTAFDVATVADITANAGLTAAQATMQILIRDLLEADETYNSTTNIAQKLIRGTATVLLTKNVTTNTACNVDTTLLQ